MSRYLYRGKRRARRASFGQISVLTLVFRYASVA